MKAALLVDDLKISKWQEAALEAANDRIDIALILNCQNTKTKKHYAKNFLYYCLNIIALRNELTKKNKLTLVAPNIVSFDSEYIGIWQSIPASVSSQLKTDKIDIIIKFGMNLLRIDNDSSSVPILSFHHGDPSKYRGRPAGFYEILNGDRTVGAIVQQLGNNLDAGKVLAFAEVRVVNHSYKRTAQNFYAISEQLLVKAIDKLAQGGEVNIDKNGRNYRLPSNLITLKFFLLLFCNAIRKIIYGLFFEKRWKVAVAKNQLVFNGYETISSSSLVELPISPKYNFYADPFYSCDGGLIRLEALRNKSGLGDILEVDADDISRQRKLLSGAHFSYPFSFIYKSKEYLLPEVASHSPQFICLADKSNSEKIIVKGLEDKRIVDATLFEQEGYFFLFFGENVSALSTLNLWYSQSPFDEFQPHPKSPIVISPRMARMGGSLLKLPNRLLRFGQNNAGEYGESLVVLEILKLSITDYEEEIIGELNVDKFNGPHSLGLNINSNQLLIDYYSNSFSFFAGIRRIKAKL